MGLPNTNKSPSTLLRRWLVREESLFPSPCRVPCQCRWQVAWGCRIALQECRSNHDPPPKNVDLPIWEPNIWQCSAISLLLMQNDRFVYRELRAGDLSCQVKLLTSHMILGKIPACRGSVILGWFGLLPQNNRHPATLFANISRVLGLVNWPHMDSLLTYSPNGKLVCMFNMYPKLITIITLKAFSVSRIYLHEHMSRTTRLEGNRTKT